MSPVRNFAIESLGGEIERLRGDPERKLDACIVIPVNAAADLSTVMIPLSDLIRYTGPYALEVVLVINNYSVGMEPPEVERFRKAGVRVISNPDVRRVGEVVIVSARALGVSAAESELTIHFDADCRIQDPTPLIDWYVEEFVGGASLAYTRVGYYDVQASWSVHSKLLIHHFARWVKRNLLRIPTTRGSNYAVSRRVFLDHYAAGRLSVDLQLGPATKLQGLAIAYSGDPRLEVLTSGRRFRGGWWKMVRYFRYRLRFNWYATPRGGQVDAGPGWEGFDRESENRKKLKLEKRK